MITGKFPVEKLQQLETPIYYYDLDLLRETLDAIKAAAPEEQFCVHYAVKACATAPVLAEIAKAGLGADCVSGGEVRAALEAGVPAQKIVFAGVAKADWEIRLGLEKEIFCFNVESLPELENISAIATEMGLTARVCLRINPNVDAHTHAKITTGLNENKFGIAMPFMADTVKACLELPGIEFYGLHFHIGSQITDMAPFAALSERINELVTEVEKITPVRNINVGGGLGIQYQHPNHFPIPDFEGYFSTYRRCLHLRDDQKLHFELGRSVVAQCGNLITRVLYVKSGVEKQFAMVDAGMTDLIRPALYDAYHRVENITNPDAVEEFYDIVGPICESSDVFVRDYSISSIRRGDLLALRSAGAYGEIMASGYNLRRLPGHVTSDDLK